MFVELEFAQAVEIADGRRTAKILALPIEHLGHRPEKVYYGQEIAGFASVLRSERGCHSHAVSITVLIKISTIVAVSKISRTIVGLVAGADLWSVWKYNTVAGLQGI